MNQNINFIALAIVMLGGHSLWAQDTITTAPETLPIVDSTAIENVKIDNVSVIDMVNDTIEQKNKALPKNDNITVDTNRIKERIKERRLRRELRNEEQSANEQGDTIKKETITKETPTKKETPTVTKKAITQQPVKTMAEQTHFTDTVSLRVYDVVNNYGLQRSFIEDSNGLQTYLAEQPQNFAKLEKLCQTIAIDARAMIADLDLDYRDGVVWLDTNLIIENYDQDRRVLQHLATHAENLKEHYFILKEEQIAKEKLMAEVRAQEEARRRQLAQNERLATVHEEIADHHRSINHICNNRNITDKTEQKTLKDLFYAYLAVYNKYDITTPKATDRLLAENNALNNFQQNLLDSVLSERSYIKRINNFKEELRQVAGREYSNVYKSYSRLFKRTNVAINFSTIDEYKKYIDDLCEIINTQQMYIQSIREQELIAINNKKIQEIYGKKYRDIASAYKDVVTGMDFTPTFLNSVEGNKYFDMIYEFQNVQQCYINNYNRLETIEHTGIALMESCGKEIADIASAYKVLLSKTSFVATFNTLEGAKSYTEKLDNFVTMQTQYDTIIKMRMTIDAQLKKIQYLKSVDKVLSTGYKNIKKTCVLTPDFTTVHQGDAFIKVLSEHIEMQAQFLETMEQQKVLIANREQIFNLSKPYKNITKAYKKLNKSYDTSKAIISMQDFELYQNIQRRHIILQEKMLTILGSANAVDVDQQLKHAGDIDRIKLVIQAQ